MMNETASEVAYEVDGQYVDERTYVEHMRRKAEDCRLRLVKQRDEWVQHRAASGVEDRWRRSSELYFGGEGDNPHGSFVETLKTGPSRQKVGLIRSKVELNIVRPKVDQAVARMCEILLPVDDRNWGIKPTPVPKHVSKMLGDKRPTVIPGSNTPTGMTADEEAKTVVEASKEAAKAMQEAIDDVLTECKYNGEQRKGIENGVRLGTMIMKGPFPVRQRSKAWVKDETGRHVMRSNDSTVPASASRDPWEVWFDPACGVDHQRGAGVWEKRGVTRKELRALIGIDGYDSAAIAEVLKSPPTRVKVVEGRVARQKATNDSYELWEYHGEIEADDMAVCSMNTGDPLDVEFGILVMVGDVVIGALESWVEDRTLPYDVWNWRKSDSSPYGHSLPEELDHQQRVVNSAWRQVMDNARVSAGSQIVFTRGIIKPLDGSYEITPNKVWEAEADKVEDVNKAFSTFDFPSHLQELLAIAQAALAFADQETSMPQLLGGEKGTSPETVGGMQMLYNSATGVLRMRVKLYDDCITVPHIGRHFDWQMANSEDDSIKGDMEVDARGSTALLEKDIQNQATLALAEVTASPRYQAYLDPKKEIEVLLKAMKINPADVMLSEDKIKANEENPPATPPDPRIAAAEMQLQGKQLDIQDRKEARAAEQELSLRAEAIDRETLQYQRQKEQGEFEIAQTESAVERDVALLKIGVDQENAAAERGSRERLKSIEIDTKRQLFNAEAALRVQTGEGI